MYKKYWRNKGNRKHIFFMRKKFFLYFYIYTHTYTPTFEPRFVMNKIKMGRGFGLKLYLKIKNWFHFFQFLEICVVKICFISLQLRKVFRLKIICQSYWTRRNILHTWATTEELIWFFPHTNLDYYYKW